MKACKCAPRASTRTSSWNAATRRTWSSPARSGSKPSSATGLRFAARSLAILARRHRDLAEAALAEELPWLPWLPADERPTCVRELLADLVAGADTGLLTPFARNLASWRSTAEAWSDPRLARELQGPFDGDGLVIDRPAEGAA